MASLTRVTSKYVKHAGVLLSIVLDNMASSLAALTGRMNAVEVKADEALNNARRAMGERYWHDMRTVLPEGAITADGQEFDQGGTYAAFYQYLLTGARPTTTEATWQANPNMRGCYVLNSSPGKFRVPDMNGVQLGSIKHTAVKGSDGSIAPGTIQTGGVPNVDTKVDVRTATGGAMLMGEVAGEAFTIGNRESTTNSGGQVSASGTTPFDTLHLDLSKKSSLFVNGLTEIRVNATVGCWVIQAIGKSFNNAGFDANTVIARAEAINADMLSKNAATNARVGGSYLNLTNPSLNSRTVMPNPFGNNTPVSCVCEIFHSTLQKWVTTPWVYSSASSIHGINAAYSEGEGVVVVTAPTSFASYQSGPSQTMTSNYSTPSPVRIRITKVN